MVYLQQDGNKMGIWGWELGCDQGNKVENATADMFFVIKFIYNHNIFNIFVTPEQNPSL